MKTDKEIKEKIKELSSDLDNFCYDNYGSEAADNGEFEISFSKYATEKTLTDFVIWLNEEEDNIFKKIMDSDYVILNGVEIKNRTSNLKFKFDNYNLLLNANEKYKIIENNIEKKTLEIVDI